MFEINTIFDKINNKIKTMKITKEQIQQLDKGETTVRELFPSQFQLKVGTWYKYNNFLIKLYSQNTPRYLQSKEYFDDGGNYNLIGNDYTPDNFGQQHLEWTKASSEEIEEALVKESLKRGFTPDSYFTAVRDIQDTFSGNLKKENAKVGGEYEYNIQTDTLYVLGWGAFVLYEKGVWAKLKPTITKAEAEKILNKVIVE